MQKWTRQKIQTAFEKNPLEKTIVRKYTDDVAWVTTRNDKINRSERN